MTIPTLTEYLHTLPLVSKKRRMLVFTDLVFTPTGEVITDGFRYFTCGIDAVAPLAKAGDLEALSKLPFALDDEGDRDTSSVLINIAYTPSGSFVAVQPVEYQNSSPVPVAPTLVLEGPAGQRLIAFAKALGD